MPTYVYKREDGTTFEIQQRISEPALKTCPTTGQPVQRVITGGTGLVFKGSGFYLTDYARKKSSPATGSSDESSSGGSKESASKENAGSNSGSSNSETSPSKDSGNKSAD